jgi:DNA mismatch endonuclease, patch repair protein
MPLGDVKRKQTSNMQRNATNSKVVRSIAASGTKGGITPPSEARRRIMRAIKSRDTQPELIVRSLAHRMGYRFRLCRKDLPGCPDLVFPRLRKVVFVHGCFWHGHDCGQGVRIPAKNRAYWKKKITRNWKRDKAAEVALGALGWESSVFWECQLKEPKRVIRELRSFLRKKNKS